LSTYSQALAHADRLYAGAQPLPSGPYSEEDALDAYRDMVDVYGRRNEIQRRIGACLNAMGDYKSSLEESPHGSPEWKLAETRFKVANLARKVLRKEILQVEPAPGGDHRYLVLSRNANSEETDDRNYALSLFADNGTSPRVLQKIPIETSWAGINFCRVYLAALKRGGPSVVILYRIYSSDQSASDQTVLAMSKGRLKEIDSFSGPETAEILPASVKHGLTFLREASWKVSWEDAYEWSGGRFVLANRNRPELFIPVTPTRPKRLHPGERRPDQDYTAWMTLGAQWDIHRRYDKGLKAWKEAERWCLRALREGDESYQFGSPFYGDPRENLKEIRQRIRWISHKDYDHELLYRPVDWGLQVPPGKLGHAMD
jgi:hypothetical protein